MVVILGLFTFCAAGSHPCSAQERAARDRTRDLELGLSRYFRDVALLFPLVEGHEDGEEGVLGRALEPYTQL